MPSVVKNLACVCDAPLTSHSLGFITVMLAAAANSAIPFVVAHRWTGDTYSTTVYDAAAHHLYRATHQASIRGWLNAIAAERQNIKVLGDKEVLKLRFIEDPSAEAIGWAA